MLITAPSARLNESIGKWSELAYSVSVDESLIGKTVYVNQAFWLPSYLEGAVTQPDAGYSIVYLPVPSRREMTLFAASETWKNYKVELLYISPTTFTIFVTSIHTQDLNSLIDSDIIPVNAERFSTGPDPSVYDVPKFHCLEIYANSEGARGYTQMKCKTWENDWTVKTFVQGEQTNGFSLTSDTVFTFELNGVPSFDYYAGVFRRGDENENDDFITDLELIYAQISGGVQQIGLDTNGYFKPNQSQDIHLVGGEYQGFCTIDKNYFTDEGEYTFFISYQIGEQWHADFYEFGEATTQGAIYGNITRTVYDYNSTSQSYDSDCVSGLSPFERVRLCASMDKASYDVALVTGGGSGSFDDNFISVEVWTGNSVYNISRNQDLTEFLNNANLTTTDTTTSLTACTEFRVPSTWAGLTKFVTFVFKFNMGDHTDYIYIPFRLTMASEDSIYSNATFQDQDGNTLTDYYCLEDVEQLVVNLDTAYASGGDIVPILVKEGRVLEEDLFTNTNLDEINALIISGDDSYTAGTTSVQYMFDAEEMTPQVEYCLRLVSKDTITTVNPSGGSCSCFNVELVQTVVNSGEFENLMQLTYNFPTLTNGQVQDVSIEAVDGDTLYEYTGDGASGTVGFFLYADEPFANVTYDFKITLTDGCTFDFLATLQTLLIDGQTTSKTFDVCNPPTNIFLLAQCFNWPTLDFTCVDEVVTPITGGVFVSNITGSDLYYSLQSESGEWTLWGGAPVTGEDQWWYWDISFDDTCPDLEVHSYISCLCSCSNSPTVGATLSGDNLTITGGGTLGSPTTSDVITYSLDGTTFLTYSTPVNVSGSNNVIFLRTVDYSDCCDTDLITGQWLRYGSDDCDYSGFDIAAWYDIVTGTHYGGKIGTDTSLLQDDLEYSLDDGLNWSTYAAGITGVNTVDWRRTLDYGNCDPEILTDQTVSPCCQELTTGVYAEAFEDLTSGTTVTLSRTPTEILSVIRNGQVRNPSTYSLSTNVVTFSPAIGYYGQTNEDIIIIYKA